MPGGDGGGRSTRYPMWNSTDDEAARLAKLGEFSSVPFD